MAARLVLPPDAPREEWLAARRQGVTASEIAVILGISPFDSPFNLYYKKRGEISEDFDNDAMSLGRHLEPWIADRWAEAHPEWQPELGGLWANGDRTWQLCTPDRLLFTPPAFARPRPAWSFYDPRTKATVHPASLLEIKSSGTYEGWGEDGSDEIPPYYRAQVLWQMDTLGLAEAHVTCLFLSSRQRRDYVIAWDEEDLKLMRGEAVEFLRRIEDGDPPPIDHTPATTHALKQLYPDVEDGVEIEVSADLAAEYAEACARHRKAEADKKHAENRLRDAMGYAKRATCDGKPVAARQKYEVREHTRAASTVDKLVPPRAKKENP